MKLLQEKYAYAIFMFQIKYLKFVDSQHFRTLIGSGPECHILAQDRNSSSHWYIPQVLNSSSSNVIVNCNSRGQTHNSMLITIVNTLNKKVELCDILNHLSVLFLLADGIELNDKLILAPFWLISLILTLRASSNAKASFSCATTVLIVGLSSDASFVHNGASSSGRRRGGGDPTASFLAWGLPLLRSSHHLPGGKFSRPLPRPSVRFVYAVSWFHS